MTERLAVSRTVQARTAPAPCPACHGQGMVFECPHWPECDCPGGTIRPGCPGRSLPCPTCTPQAGDAFNHPL